MRCVVPCGIASFPRLVFCFACFICIQEDECDKAVHQSYPGNERNAAFVADRFHPCHCCCHLCCTGEYQWLGTLASLLISCVFWIFSHNWAKVLEALGCLKLLSIYLVASGVDCHQLWFLSSDLHAVGCWRLCRDAQLILTFLLPLLLSHRCHQQRRLLIVLPPMLTVPSRSCGESFIDLSRSMLKRVGESRHPCRTSTVIRNSLLSSWS